MKIVDYIKDTRGEMKHVSWPTRNQSIGYSILVVVLSLLTSLYLGLFDFLFSKILQKIV